VGDFFQIFVALSEKLDFKGGWAQGEQQIGLCSKCFGGHRESLT